MQIAIGLPIGYQAGAGGAVGVFDYLVNDTFTTDRAAGAVDGALAEPGPGERSVTDTNSKLTIATSKLTFATGGSGNGDPGLWYGGFGRTPGLIILAQVTPTSGRIEIGYDGDQDAAAYDTIRINGTSLQIRNAAIPIDVGAVVSTTAYQVAVIVRNPSAFWLIKGGAFSSWSLLYGSETVPGAEFDIFPTINGFSNTVAVCDYLRVPALRWLPVPLVSDGFVAWGTSDGLGHVEGVTGGLGSGGNAITWTARIGTWTASAGQAAAKALSSSKAAATAATGKADVMATINVTRAAGVAGLLLRYVDADNFVYAVHNGTNAQLVKRVAGSETTLINTAAAYSAGAQLRAVCEGTQFRLYYNDVFIGSEQTIADAALQAPTAHGLYTTDTSNTFDDFTVYARGSAGEYDSVLDAI